MTVDSLAVLFIAACIGAISFQIAILAGAPWGHLTQGGRFLGKLPIAGRAVALVSIIILLLMALAVSSAAGGWPNWPDWTGWVALSLQTASTVVNWITPSRPERLLWGPINSVMLGLAAAVVLWG
jgi:hypothetical protein